MKTSIDFIYDTLTKRGWTLKKQHCETDELPKCIKDRYHNIPAEYITFLCNIRTCVNPGETAWLLGAEDFSTQGEDVFRWNEFEMICLQAAIEENDTEWQCDIKAFWDNHLPFCFSVGGGYEYYAIRMNDGVIVHGFGPEFEETTDTAESFEKFIELLCAGEISL